MKIQLDSVNKGIVLWIVVYHSVLNGKGKVRGGVELMKKYLSYWRLTMIILHIPLEVNGLFYILQHIKFALI